MMFCGHLRLLNFTYNIYTILNFVNRKIELFIKFFHFFQHSIARVISFKSLKTNGITKPLHNLHANSVPLSREFTGFLLTKCGSTTNQKKKKS